MQLPRIKNIVIVIIALFSSSFIFSQNENSDKEIIIIEKIRDTEGNIISKSTKRYSGKYSEQEIQDLIDEGAETRERSFSLDELGFGKNFGDLFQTPSRRPTIGVNLNFDSGIALVEKVNLGSGAYDADIRKGDQLISINGMAINGIEDIFEVLDTKTSGDQVTLVIVRDGAEIEKDVTLGQGSSGGMFFEFPEDGQFELFGDGLSMDSLFNQFRLMPEFWNPYENDEAEEKVGEDETPSLGIFIDEQSSEIMIAEVIKNSPADKAGLKKGDEIIRMDDNQVGSFKELKAVMNTKKNNDTLLVEVRRDNKIKKIKVQLD